MRKFLLPLIVLGTACGSGDACKDHFTPYEDVVSGRLRTERNAAFIDGMAHYAQGDFLEASTLLATHVEGSDHEPLPRLYLACSYLATGKPYDAELQLDLIERDDHDAFRDHVDWYRALCHVCSDQVPRARTELQAIVAKPRHTFHAQAEALLNDLPDRTNACIGC
ncbi:MAG: hypothetical protein IPJ76_18390 [Flavobacteriales bacterium]|nr:MAG: hypothetical protein IPJ76_18390 [Flavobacteriales bacterium]